MFYTCNYNIRVTHKMVLLNIFFANQIQEDHQQIVLYSFCRSMRLPLHLAVKILLQIFLYEDLSTLALHTSVGCISSECQLGPHFIFNQALINENILIFDINHQQNTERSDQIET